MLKSRFIFLLVGIIIFVHGLLLTKLIFFPYPEFFIYPYLTNHGLKPYAQILDQHFPGLLFNPINLDNLGMNNAEVARVWLIVIVVITQILIYLVSRQVLKDDKKALLVSVLYLIWQPFFEGWVLWIDSFLPLILLPAFYALHKKRLFACGLLLGIGIIFKQTLIPLALLILVYVLWEQRKLALIFLFGLAGPIILMLVYLANIGVLKDFFYWTLFFNLTTYAKYGTSIPPSFGYVARIMLVYGASTLAYFNKEDKRLIQILFIFFLGSLAGIFDRADFVHFQPSLPFALMSTVYGLGRLGKLGKVKLIWISYLLVAGWWLNIFYKGHLGNRVLSFDTKTYQLSFKIKQYTKPLEKIFIFGAPPHLYQMSKTLPAGNIFVFQFPWFLKVAEGRILDGIETDKPRIVVSDRTVKIEGQPISEFAKDIDQYIQKNYEIIDQVGTTLILRSKAL